MQVEVGLKYKRRIYNVKGIHEVLEGCIELYQNGSYQKSEGATHS